MSRPDRTLTFEDQVRLSRLLPKLARMIDKEISKAGLPRAPWSLYTWGGNRCQYVSNTAREDAKTAMRECLDRWEEPQDPPPHQGFS
jgi:hypothetical protein